MKSLYDFIVSPLEGRYNNTKKIGGKTLIINTKIETFKNVSKEAMVIEVPAAYKTKIKKGDKVFVHHNVFRRFYDIKGKEKNSRSYFKDDMYFCDPMQIYMYNNKSHLNYCFVSPVKNIDKLSNNKEQTQLGILKYTNKTLEALGITPGTLITFTPDSEFEFIINGERLYCMKSNNIALTHEYKGNEKENNPSWAKSS
jgi:hypothetical protein|tara:strand:+ start:6136 stop:6729 length:594 start_codon:yes stop_codon:yes gene_type:complete